ncbi:hypothetical protein AGMMS49942_05340 [Spirochaetia bacterium]|nr:hypothetical protein AGMMS49942_05340 [Spirochaetia bacterium]
MKKFFVLSVFMVMLLAVSYNVFSDEKLLKEYTTYQTPLVNMDIAQAFFTNSRNYLSKANYYLCNYEIYSDKNDQNYAWTLEIYQNTYEWGTVFNICFFVSNGIFRLKCSESNFNFRGIPATEIITFNTSSFEINDIFTNVVRSYTEFTQESIMGLKKFGDNYGEKSRAALSFPAKSFSDKKEQAALEQVLKDRAVIVQAERDRATREQMAREQAAREQIAREQAARDRATREQMAREQAAREQIAREQEQARRLQQMQNLGGILGDVFGAASNALGNRYTNHVREGTLTGPGSTRDVSR